MANSKEKFKKSLRQLFRRFGIVNREKHREYIARIEPFIPIALFINFFYSAYYFISRALDFFSNGILYYVGFFFLFISIFLVKSLEDFIIFAVIVLMTLILSFVSWKAANIDFSKYKEAPGKRKNTRYYILGHAYIIAVSIVLLFLKFLRIENYFINLINKIIETAYGVLLFPVLFLIILVLGSFGIFAVILTITGLKKLAKKINENNSLPWKNRVQSFIFWFFLIIYFVIITYFWTFALYITLLITPIMIYLPAAVSMRALFARDGNSKSIMETRLGKTLAEVEEARLKKELRKKQKAALANTAAA